MSEIAKRVADETDGVLSIYLLFSSPFFLLCANEPFLQCDNLVMTFDLKT